MCVSGVKDISSINPESSLADLGIDSLMGVEVKQTLERDFDVCLSMREIRQLSISKLRAISGASGDDDRAVKQDKENSTGLGSHLEDSGVSVHYDLTQLLPIKTVVPLNSIDNMQTPVFIVHPIEGVFSAITQRDI